MAVVPRSVLGWAARRKAQVVELVGRRATELAAMVRSGEARAVEVVSAHLDHLEAVDERLGAFVSSRRQEALEEAEALDARGDRDELPLAGVPISVKDVIDLGGEPTRHGSLATSAEPAAKDAEVVANLRAAGAVVIGKTRVPELALWGTSDDPDGAAVSPWDPTRTAGGSSGGAAAAVGAGVVPLSLAADGFGSVRIPAAACGVVGIKPGGDLVPEMLNGAHHFFGMSRFGPIATSVADAALALDVMAGTDSLRSLAPLDRELKIAVSWRAPAPGVVVTSTWREAAIEAGRLLRHLGHDVTHADPPYDRAMVQAGVARWTQTGGVDIEAMGLDVDDLQPRTRAHVAAGARLARVSPVREEEAIRWQDRAGNFFTEHDILVTPVFARTQPAAMPWHGRPWAANVAANLSAYPFAPPWNISDQPAIAVPLWHDDGRPLSIQVVAGHGCEDLVLGVAAQLESLVPWRRHAPGWGVPGA